MVACKPTRLSVASVYPRIRGSTSSWAACQCPVGAFSALRVVGLAPREMHPAPLPVGGFHGFRPSRRVGNPCHPDFCPQRGVDFPAHLVNASAAALSGVGGLNSDSVCLSDLARALDGECKLQLAGRPPDGHHPTGASAHGLGNPLKRASSVMIYNEKDRQKHKTAHASAASTLSDLGMFSRSHTTTISSLSYQGK